MIVQSGNCDITYVQTQRNDGNAPQIFAYMGKRFDAEWHIDIQIGRYRQIRLTDQIAS